ncbi:MAG: hypothetical protein IJF76_03680 [Clostridia bacterium]|nr:hypothetical protein [Clostridia bacterium]
MSAMVEKKFIACCDKYASSKLILSGPILGELLRLIANEPELYAVLETSAKDFNFRKEFESAQIKTNSGYMIRLPQNKRALIALVASILYSFDNNSISILDFLDKFFPSTDGVKESYPVFAREIVIPFRDAVVSVLRGEASQGVEVETLEAINEEPAVRMPNGVVVQGGMILRSMNKLVMEDGSIESRIKNEYLEIIDGAIHALEIKDVKMVRSFFIAMRYVFADRRALQARLRELLSCYKLYMIM